MSETNEASVQSVVMRLSRDEARSLQWKCLSVLYFLENVEDRKSATLEEIVHFLGRGAEVCKLV